MPSNLPGNVPFLCKLFQWVVSSWIFLKWCFMCHGDQQGSLGMCFYTRLRNTFIALESHWHTDTLPGTVVSCNPFCFYILTLLHWFLKHLHHGNFTLISDNIATQSGYVWTCSYAWNITLSQQSEQAYDLA